MDLGAITNALGGLLGGVQQQQEAADHQGAQGGFNPAMLAALLPVVMQFINSKGGIQGVIEMFSKADAGNTARSWVDSGDNAQVSPQQVSAALGPDIDKIAQRAGVPKEQAASGIAALLPQVVDSMTPGGELPSNDDLSSVINSVLGRRS